MAEINAVIAEASQDLQTIEDFVNLPAGSDVRPRLLPSVNVGTLAGARQAIFEAGGLPATPFATKALMTASPLVDGKYAMVTNDAVNNGLYVKEAGAWVKSGYDPLVQAKADATTKSANAVAASISYIDNIFNSEPNIVEIKPIFGEAINATSPESTKFLVPNDARAYLELDVLGARSITISGSTVPPAWRWVFRDANDAYISMSDAGSVNNTFTVPNNARWAYRTYQIGDLEIYESQDLSITIEDRYEVKDVVEAEVAASSALIEARLYSDKNYTNIAVVPIEGAVAETTPTRPTFLNPQYSPIVAKYMMFNVSDFKTITVSQSVDVQSWNWVFKLNDGGKIISKGYGNGTYAIPDNAVEAYRTVYYKSSVDDYDNTDLVVTATYKKPRMQLQIYEHAKKQATYKLIDKMEGMLADGNVISPNDFSDTTQTERIKSAVAFARLQGFGIVELATDAVLSTDIWTITEAIRLPSNCWIYINNSTVKKADDIFDNIFRNDGIVPDANPFNTAIELKENHNIRIFGNDKLLSKIIGNRSAPKTAPHPVIGGDPIPWLGDNYGWRAIGVLFANTKSYRVYNLSISEVTSWSISNEHGCEDFKYHDLVFDNNVANGDGVDVRMGCKDFEIYNISGKTSDDTVALSAINEFVGQHPTGNYIYPIQVGGYADRGHGVDITDGKVWNIKGNNSNAGVLVLYTGGSKVQRISINNISDEGLGFKYYLIRILSNIYGADAAMGDGANITINNITSLYSPDVIQLRGKIKDSWINNVKQLRPSELPAINPNATYESDNLKITNITQVPNV